MTPVFQWVPGLATSKVVAFAGNRTDVLRHSASLGDRRAPDRVRCRAGDGAATRRAFRAHRPDPPRLAEMVEGCRHRDCGANGAVALGHARTRGRRRAPPSRLAKGDPSEDAGVVGSHIGRDAVCVPGSARHDHRALRRVPERPELQVADRRLRAGRARSSRSIPSSGEASGPSCRRTSSSSTTST